MRVAILFHLITLKLRVLRVSQRDLVVLSTSGGLAICLVQLPNFHSMDLVVSQVVVRLVEIHCCMRRRTRPA